MKLKVEIPLNCPSCSTKLTRVKDQLFCKNNDCQGVGIKGVINFCKALKIKGLGEKRVEALGLDYIPDIYTIEDSDLKQAFGTKVASSIREQINTSLHCTYKQVLAALPIPLIGKTASEKLFKEVSNISSINKEVCAKAGLGTKATESLITWLSDNEELITSLPEYETDQVLEASLGNVCISGKLKTFKTKAEANKFLSGLGFKVVDSVTKNTSYLINEDGKVTSKVTKANKLNIEVLTIEELKGKL